MTQIHTQDVVAGESQAAVYQEMFQSLLRTPHRQGDETLHGHLDQFHRDPNFYGKLAVWALDGNNVIRDINEIFVAILFVSEFPEHREAAYAMMQSFPPYQVERIMHYVTGYDEIIKHVSIGKKQVPDNGKFGVTVERARFGKKHPKAGEEIPRKRVHIGKEMRRELLRKGLITSSQKDFRVDTYLVKHAALNKRTVRSMLRNAIRTYLRFREKAENQGMMEGALIRARDVMFGLYMRSHTLPCGDEKSWVNQYLFRHTIDKNSEQGKRLAALKLLGKTEDPVTQAELIVEHKLPYTQVVSVLTNITPTVLVALIDAMSPQELLNSLVSLKARGVYRSADLKKMVMDKLAKIKTTKSKRIDAMKGAKAAKAVEGLDADVAQAAVDATDAQMKFHGTIKAKTALLIDKSTSMEVAITVGKEIGAAIAQGCQQPPLTYMFDSMPTEITWKTSDGDITTKSSWDDKLRMFRPSGGTAPHTVVKAMLSRDVQVEQILLVTDEGENTVGLFTEQMKTYEKRHGYMPNIVIARVGNPRTGYPWGASDRMEKSLKAAGIDVEVLKCENVDEVSIPNLMQLLSRKSIFDLLLDISALPLPTRAGWDKAHNMK